MVFSYAIDVLLSRLRGAWREPPGLEAEVTRWFVEEREPVARYAMSLGLSAPDAEDVAQDVFLALFHHLRQGKPRENLRGWIFRVARNLALKRRVAAQRMAAITGRCAATAADPAPDPETSAEWRDEQSRLLAIVNALPERDRSCLALRAEGLTYREIAEALGISLGAVALAISRALAKLTAARTVEVLR